MIYLDHNATTPLDKRVRQEMLKLGDEPLNPSSVHSFGRLGKSLLEKTRRQIAKMLNINLKEYRVIFTSGGTEANNLILQNFSSNDEDLKNKIVISNIEHASIFEQQSSLPNIELTEVNRAGMADLGKLEQKLKSRNFKLVSVMLANNETGAIQPIKDITEVAHKYDAQVHCDATCGAGKIKVDIAELGVDFLTISAHKFGGPKGVGALVVRADFPLKASLYGGKQEQGLRAGTENVEAIVGFGEAAELATLELSSRITHMQNLQQKLEEELERNFKVKIIAKENLRLPNTTLILAE